MRLLRVVTLAVLAASPSCGVVVLQDAKVQAPQNAPREIRAEWNPAEHGRQEMLKGTSDYVDLETCQRYRRVESLDPGFRVGTLTGAVTVRDRVEEVCHLTAEAIGRCRASKHESQCPDLATAADLVAAVQRHPADPAHLPAWLPAQLRADLSLWTAGRYYSDEARRLTGSHRAGQVGACETVNQLRAITAKVPDDIRRQYAAALTDEQAASAHFRELQQREETAARFAQQAARSGAAPDEAVVPTSLHQQVALALRLSPSAALPFLSVLDENEMFVAGIYRRGAILRGAVLNPEVLRQAGKPTIVAPDSLRSTAAEVRCMQDYRPAGANMLTAAQLADELEKLAVKVDGDLARMTANAASQQAVEAQCQADPECLKQRQVEGVLAELCGYVKELDETKAQMRERLAEAGKWGVINVGDQHDDLETKQFLEEMIAKEEENYRAISGKAFKRSVCVQREAEMVLHDLCDTLKEIEKADRPDIKGNLKTYAQELKEEYRQVTGKGFQPGMCKKVSP